MKASERIIVVDRASKWRRFVVDALRSAGYEVSIHDGAQATLREIATRGSDLVLADASLDELVMALATEHEDTRFIVFTASPSVAEAITALRLGALDYEDKAYDASSLLDTVVEALRKPAVQSPRFLPL